MTLIKSISGIRGTIGGQPGEGLSPLDIVKFTSSFSYWIIDKLKAQDKLSKKEKIKPQHFKLKLGLELGITRTFRSKRDAVREAPLFR